MAADIAATLQRTLENYSRIWLMTTEIIANPTQANIDTLVAAAGTTGVMRPKPTYSVDGESYNWLEYQQALDAVMTGVKNQLIKAQGPFEIRSRAASY